MESNIINILIGGQAGQGIDFAADIISRVFSKIRYYVFNYRYYQSVIRGGHNYNIVTISKDKIHSFYESDIDYFIVFDNNSINIHKTNIDEKTVLFGDEKIPYKDKINVNVEYFLKKLNLPNKYANTVVLSAFFKYIGIDKNIVISSFSEKSKDENNNKIVDIVYSEFNISSERKILPLGKKARYYLSGAEAIAYGAILAGLDIYIAYPMTPASPILHVLASLKDKYNIVTYQPDNEIGVINIALGSSYAGGKVMVGSSGGGIDLMAEAISMAGMAELPIVIAWLQRYGPSTGMATHFDQSDLLEALYIGHGEFPRIVVSPGDHIDAMRRTIEAFYLSYKYNTPSIILSDLFLVESKANYDHVVLPNIDYKNRFIDLEPPKDYKNYKITEEGFILRSIPGLDVVVKANSYEHDEYGFETENPEIGQRMSEKRLNKSKYIYKEIINFDPYEIYGDGNKIIVSWGSNKMPILEALKYLNDWKYLHISYLSPFPSKIKGILEDHKKVVLVEHNLTGQLGKLIEQETGFYIEDRILKHNGEPFKVEELVDKIKKI